MAAPDGRGPDYGGRVRALTDPDRRRALSTLIALSLLACVVKVLGDALGLEWTERAQWFYLPPLMAALVVAGGLRDRRGWWWLGGLVLSWCGDVLGGLGFLVLLGSFLLAHLCFVVALLPTARGSVLRRPVVWAWVAFGLIGAAVIAPAAGPVLAAPVVVYAATLTFVAVLATAAGRLGVVGGLLFMASDLVLGAGIFALDLDPALQTALVIGTYVPAQVLLLLAFLGLTGQGASARGARTPPRPAPVPPTP